MIGKRPTDYDDWRKLWLQHCKWIGIHIVQSEIHGHSTCAKYLWKLKHRANRLWMRMEVEKETMSESYCAAIYEWFVFHSKNSES